MWRWNMRRSIGKTLLCLVVATTFLTPLLGDTARSEEVFCVWEFVSYDTGQAWETNPQYMVDGNQSTYTSTTIDEDVELLDENDYDEGYSYNITKVELRAKGYYTGNFSYIILRPVFGGTDDGDDHRFLPKKDLVNASWSEWFDITDDPNAGPVWNWDEVTDLDCDVEAESPHESFTVYCSMVEIRVHFIVP